MVDRAPSGMRRFTMRREQDVSGVSGIGNVLEGVLFSTGVCVIHWLTPPPRGSIRRKGICHGESWYIGTARSPAHTRAPFGTARSGVADEGLHWNRSTASTV